MPTKWLEIATAFELFRGKNPTHPAIAQFNSVSRSTNDELSYLIRYSVLNQFIQTGKLSDDGHLSFI